MKCAEAYYSEIFHELWNSEVSQKTDFESDVDQLIIEEIHSRIPETDIDNWIKANPDSVEARTLLFIEA